MSAIFLICPVRNASPEATERVKAYVAGLESGGHRVHWPARDTAQDDPIGTRICVDNASAMLVASEVHVWFEASSQGTIFDAGMLFMALHLGFEKRVVIANPEALTPTAHKSFQNVLLALANGERP